MNNTAILSCALDHTKLILRVMFNYECLWKSKRGVSPPDNVVTLYTSIRHIHVSFLT